MTPNMSTGRYSLSRAIETSNGSRVSDATRSGPAEMAIPSPTLVMNDAESSQRKLEPSLAGEIISMIRTGRDRTGGRIPTDPGPRVLAEAPQSPP
jgi:hypothetical protein